MTPKFGQFPFCGVPASSLAGSPGSDYPVGMFAADILDAFLNAKVLKVSIDAVQDGGGGGGALGGFVYTHRKIIDGCLGVQHVSNSRGSGWNADIRLDFSKTVRKPRGTNTVLYYPSLVVTFIADSTRLSSKTEAEETGSIDFLSKYFITLYANRDMVVFGGGVSIVERYDEITFSPASGPVGTAVTITGATFDGVTSVRFGDVEAAFTISTDKRTVTATVPAGAKLGPISFDQDEDRYSTRSYFKVI